MKNTLFKIEAKYLDIIGQVEENEGELTPELNEALAINECELAQKSIGFIEIISLKKSMIERIKVEKKRLDGLQKHQQNIVNRLEQSLSNAVDIFGDIELGLHTIKHRTSTQVLIENEDLLPVKFMTKTLTVKADKNAIKKALQQGETIEGASLITNKNLSIK